jgi:hypothetical protein
VTCNENRRDDDELDDRVVVGRSVHRSGLCVQKPRPDSEVNDGPFYKTHNVHFDSPFLFISRLHLRHLQFCHSDKLSLLAYFSVKLNSKYIIRQLFECSVESLLMLIRFEQAVSRKTSIKLANADSRSFREFAAKNFVRSSRTQKQSCSALKELSNSLSFIVMRAVNQLKNEFKLHD